MKETVKETTKCILIVLLILLLIGEALARRPATERSAATAANKAAVTRERRASP